MWMKNYGSNKDFLKAKEAISTLFLGYSPKDVCKALLCMGLWVPNNSCSVKQAFWGAIFASQKKANFAKDDKILTFSDFKEFAERLIELTPSFYPLEDFISQHDWGDVCYFFDGAVYNIFFGNDPESVVDWLLQFESIHTGLNDAYSAVADVSPNKDFSRILAYQNAIITGIETQPEDFDRRAIDYGHVEVPSKEFWDETTAFFDGYQPDHELVEAYKIPFESCRNELQSFGNFQDAFQISTALPGLFVVDGDDIFPVSPRRSSELMIERWGKEYAANKADLELYTENPTHQSIADFVSNYIGCRLRHCQIFRNVRAVNPDNSPHDYVCPIVLGGHQKLIQIHLVDPPLPGESLSAKLDALGKQIIESNEIMLSKQPISFFVGDEGYGMTSGNDETEIINFIVIPLLSLRHVAVEMSYDISAQVVWMADFLGIIDDTEYFRELVAFADFLDENRRKIIPMASFMDRFALFKDSHGVVEQGATTYNMIFVDPHSGTEYRFDTLKKFWRQYPRDHLFEHPSDWDKSDPRLWVLDEKSQKCVLMANKGGGLTFYCFSRIGSAKVIITAPFTELKDAEKIVMRHIKFMIDCIEDTASRNEDIVSKHVFFQSDNELRILIFPLSHIEGKEEYKGLLSVANPKEQGKAWAVDMRYDSQDDFHLMTVVYDDEKIMEEFSKVTDASAEHALLKDILSCINDKNPDSGIGQMFKDIDERNVNQPRFKMEQRRKPASFPEDIDPLVPDSQHYKLARKVIAKQAKELGIEPGTYSGSDGKKKMNELKALVVKEINERVNQFSFGNAIPYLIERIDALNMRLERKRMELDISKQHQVDFDRAEKHLEAEKEFKDVYRDYRYLIEKFVQLQPEGQKDMTADEFKNLIALVHWLQNIQAASDCLHYAVFPMQIEITSEYVVNPEFVDIDDKEDVFWKEEMEDMFSLKGEKVDKLESPTPFEDSIANMNKAFLSELGFTLMNMFEVLTTLSYWADHRRLEEQTSYSATEQEIADTCISLVGDNKVSKDEINKILKFLTLHQDEILKIQGSEKVEDDIPIWEHKKRPARYSIRPLVKIGDAFLWGAMSTKKAVDMWYQYRSTGLMPIEMGAAIRTALDTENQKLEAEISKKAKEIVGRKTTFVDGEVFPHHRDPKGGHPSDLGDYDVIAFLPDKNTVLNIECKELRPDYCLKDARTRRENIFGDPAKPGDEGHFTQINKREKYLEDHLMEIAKLANPKWSIDGTTPPKIVTIYLSRRKCWWTRFPPDHIHAYFLTLDELSDFIDSL